MVKKLKQAAFSLITSFGLSVIFSLSTYASEPSILLNGVSYATVGQPVNISGSPHKTFQADIDGSGAVSITIEASSDGLYWRNAGMIEMPVSVTRVISRMKITEPLVKARIDSISGGAVTLKAQE